MSIAEGPHHVRVIARAEAILLRPLPEWDAIATENATPGSLFTGYGCILAAIGPVAILARRLTFSGLLFFHWSVGPIIGAVALDYGLSLGGVWLLGLVIDATAPNYGAQKNPLAAMKLAVYAATPVWIAGAFALTPWLDRLWVLGLLWGLYLFYLGLPKLMKPAPERQSSYFVVTVAVAVVIGVIFARMVEVTAFAYSGDFQPRLHPFLFGVAA
jgi:hypothetical protein